MKQVVTAIALALPLALGGCGQPVPAAAPPTASAAPTPSTTPSPTPSAFTVSEKATCTQLIGPNEDGPLIKYITGVASGNVSDTAAMRKIVEARDAIKDIAERANPEMKVLLKALFSEDVNDFKAAGTDLLTRCS